MRTLAHWIGRALALASIAFIAVLVWRNADTLRGARWDALWWPFVACLLAYGATTLLMARGWFELLRALGERALPWSQAWRIQGRSQIAKYLPGNVLHFAGRQLFGREAGVAHGVLAMSSLLEAGGMIAAAMLIGLLAAPDWAFAFGQRHAGVIAVALIAGAAATLALWAWLRRRGPLRDVALSLPRVALAGAVYLVFFVVTGLIAAALAAAVFELPLAACRPVVGAYAVAWILGFVVPGAPGGMGVREAALLAMLHALAPEAALVLFVLLLRLVTIGGDVLLFCAAIGANALQRRRACAQGTPR